MLQRLQVLTPAQGWLFTVLGKNGDGNMLLQAKQGLSSPVPPGYKQPGAASGGVFMTRTRKQAEQRESFIVKKSVFRCAVITDCWQGS